MNAAPEESLRPTTAGSAGAGSSITQAPVAGLRPRSGDHPSVQSDSARVHVAAGTAASSDIHATQPGLAQEPKAAEAGSNPASHPTCPFVVYFSSVSENTHRFVTKLGFPSVRIPLYPKDEPLTVDLEYVLLVPTYGGGSVKGAVPKQVIRFLNNSANRALCRGVISSGNTNFGEAYCIAGDIIAAKLQVPFLYRYELLGTPTDVQKVQEGLEEFWQTL